MYFNAIKGVFATRLVDGKGAQAWQHYFCSSPVLSIDRRVFAWCKFIHTMLVVDAFDVSAH